MVSKRSIRSSREAAGFAAFLVLALTAPRPARAQLVGSEFQVNSFTTNYQASSAVAPAGAAGFVVVWDSYLQDGAGRSVFGQRFLGDGTPDGGEFPINTHTTLAQGQSAVAGDAAGNFVVAWTSYQQEGGFGGSGVFAQRYDAAGAPLAGEFRVNSYTTGDQKGVSVAAEPSGDFAVVWWSVPAQDGSGEGVFTQRYDPNGALIGGEAQVNLFTTGQQWKPAVAADGVGNFVVAWSSDEQDGDAHGVFARLFDGSGAPVSGEIPVNQFTTGAQTAPSVATDAAGNFVVVWASNAQDGSSDGIYARHFDAAGTPTGDELRVNVATLGEQNEPAIAGDGAGGFIVSWQDTSFADVFARRLDATGAPAGNEFRANSFTTDSQRRPAVAATVAGEFVVTWTSSFQVSVSDDVFAQRIRGGLFHDGFATADVCGWSSAVGSGGVCP